MQLNKAEVYFARYLKELLENGHRDVNPRAKYEDGKTANSTFISQVVEKYDICKGDFPITETRYIAWKTGINEILAIYQSQTNTKEGFEKHGCYWWTPWMNEEDNIGRAYSHNIESHRPNEMKRSIVKIKIKKVDNANLELSDIKLFDISDCYIEELTEYLLLKKESDENIKGRNKYYIQSKKTGECQWVSYKKYVRLKNKGHFANNHSPFKYDRNYYGVGYLGDVESVKNLDGDTINILKRKWIGMLKRCYSNDGYYKEFYGKTFVHNRWHDFSNFLNDVRTIPQFHLALEDSFRNWELDKDYYGANAYSKETCVFLKSSENKLYANNKVYKIIHPDGQITITINLTQFCRKVGISQGNASAVINGSRTNVGGYTFNEINSDDDNVYRYELSRNQINELLNELMENKYSRRHMTSFFNWSNQNKKMLVECAYETLWTVYEKDGENFLDLTLIQRSSDVCTANHINKIQYVALMMMVAKHCSYKCGNFMHVVQNYHVYDSHLSNVKELLNRIEILKQRETQSKPQLILNVPEGTNFYDIKLSDFSLTNYNPITPQLKFPLAI